MNRNRHAISYAIWIISMVLSISCQRANNGPKLTVEELDYNDSLVYAAMEHDFNQALLVVDSLEDVHALYDAKINYYRAQIHYKMGQELSAELYYKKALAGDELYKERPAIYYFAYDQLSTILTIKGDQQGAMATATECYSKARTTIRIADRNGRLSYSTTSDTVRCSLDVRLRPRKTSRMPITP